MSKKPLSDDNNNYRTRGLIEFPSVLEKYIKENIAYDFDDGEDTVKTNVVFSNPEQWSEIKEASSLKVNIDGNHVNLPVISLYRTDITINKSRIPHWVADKYISYAIAKINEKTVGDQEYTKTVLQRRGIYIETFYNIEIIAQNNMHLDHLIEQFILHEGKYWSDGENFSVRVTYDSFPDSSQPADQNQERIISTSFNLQMNGQILPKYRKEDELVGKKMGDVIKVNFDEKIVNLN